ncbi:hypothetical protein D3C72_1919830 [compost metagenome]
MSNYTVYLVGDDYDDNFEMDISRLEKLSKKRLTFDYHSSAFDEYYSNDQDLMISKDIDLLIDLALGVK